MKEMQGLKISPICYHQSLPTKNHTYTVHTHTHTRSASEIRALGYTLEMLHFGRLRKIWQCCSQVLHIFPQFAEVVLAIRLPCLGMTFFGRKKSGKVCHVCMMRNVELFEVITKFGKVEFHQISIKHTSCWASLELA